MKHLSKIQEYLFYLILIVLPFGTRHIFNFAQIQNIEGFRENISRSVYSFDIPFILLVLTYFFTPVFQYTGVKKSASDADKYNSQEHLRQNHTTSHGRRIMYIFFIAWILLSSLFAENISVAFYDAARIIEAVLFFLVAKNLLQSREVLQKSALIIFLGGIFQSILAIFQFVLQKSIGLKLLGESLISPQILGVAKMEIGGTIWQNVFQGEKIIRAYGTLPHPNFLGAFLLFSFICGMFIYKLISQKLKMYLFGLSIILLGILLTFSRSIWLVTFVFLVIYSLKNLKLIENLPADRQGCKLKIENLKSYKIFVFIFAVLLFLYTILPRLCLTNCRGDQSFTLRQSYNKISFQIIKDNPLLGVGPGNFTISEPKYDKNLQSWEIQPAHNLYLLIASEIGIVGLLIFFVLIYAYMRTPTYKNIPHKKDCYVACYVTNYVINYLHNPFALLFLLFLVLSFLDHYFWTLPQGQLLFWLSLAFLAASGRIKEEFKQTT